MPTPASRIGFRAFFISRMQRRGTKRILRRFPRDKSVQMLFGYFHGLDIDRNIRQNGIFSTRCCDVIRFSRFVPYGFGIADQRGIFGDGAHHADDIQILKAVEARIPVVRNAFQVIINNTGRESQ